MKRSTIFLSVVAAVIVALCAYKATRTYQPVGPPPETRAPLQSAQMFDLFDATAQHRERLAAYHGRHEILVVFFEREAGAGKDPLLTLVRGAYPKLKGRGLIVLGISDALPQENRKEFQTSGECPFPLLSDPGHEVSRAWGRVDARTGATTRGLFHLDRAGTVAWEGEHPKPSGEPEKLVERLSE